MVFIHLLSGKKSWLTLQGKGYCFIAGDPFRRHRTSEAVGDISLLKENVYYPPGHFSEFLSTAFSELADLNVRNIFVGGDFNCHLNPCIDTFPAGRVASYHSEFLNSLCEDLDYIDVWRTQHPTDRGYMNRLLFYT